MKKPVTIKQAIIGLLVGITALFGGNAVVEDLGGGRANQCGQMVSSTSTTTSATDNQLVVANNADRCNLVLTNDSDTTMYLYRGYFGSYTDASTTNIANTGIRLNANGGTYEMDTPGIYTGEIWLGTTTAGKVLTISELK